MRRQSGVALLIVMFVMTLMVLIAAEITTGVSLALRRVGMQQQIDQARWYTIAAEELAVKGLHDALGEEDTVHLGQYWATGEMSFPLEGGSISGELLDGTSCLNLNAMQAADQNSQTSAELRVFRSLMEIVEIEPFRAEAIAEATRDWVDGDDTQNSSLGAEDSYYQSLPLPYMAGNTSMRDVSELRAVKDVNAAIMRRIAPYVCALPTTEFKVNVNTLQPEQAALLSALFFGDLPVDQAESVLTERPVDGWSSVDEFLQEPLLSNFRTESNKSLLSVSSDYFVLRSEATFGQVSLPIRTLLAREGEDKFRVVLRRSGGIE